MYGDGHARRSGVYESTLEPGVDFAQLAASAGAHGERLTEPDQVDAALQRAFAALRAGQAAVLQVAVGAH
jgi:acetolactate synthase-1/2/3 large subunit